MNDGGQWDMIVNLINKHGLIPKKNFPESVSSESSGQVNSILTSKVRNILDCRSIILNLKKQKGQIFNRTFMFFCKYFSYANLP